MTEVKTTGNMLNVKSARFGEVEVNEDQLITFPSGIAGFEELKRWCLLHIEDTPDFNWLQSLEDESIALLLADPDELFQNYVADIQEDQVADLELPKEEESVPSLVMRVILKWDEEKRRFFANLRAPIIFNLDNRYAVQTILQNANYSMREEVQTKSSLTEEAPATIVDSGEGHAEARI